MIPLSLTRSPHIISIAIGPPHKVTTTMSENTPSKRPVSIIVSIVVCLIIIADFALPGSPNTEEIINIKRETQTSYNAARRTHTTFQVITQNYEFYVDKGFAKGMEVGNPIDFKVSPLFSEVNNYTNSEGETSSFGLRRTSGLWGPLVILLVMLLSFRFQGIKMAVFIAQVLLLANLFYLLL